MYLDLPPASNPPDSSQPSTSLKPHDSEVPSSAPDTQLDREPSDPVQKAAVLQSHQLSPDATIHNQSNSTSKLTMYSLSSLCVLVFAVFLFGSGITATPSLQSIADFIRGKRHEKSPHSSSIYKTRFPHVTWDNSAWKIHNTHLDQGHYQSRIPVANGYLGISVAAVGPFFEVESPVNGDSIGGWPLFEQRFSLATISGFFDSEPQLNATNFEWLNQYGGESAISGVPHWAGLVVDLGDNTYLDASVDSSTISHFSSTLSAKEGVVTWEYTWTPEGRDDLSFQVAYTMFAHKEYVNQGFVQLRIKPSADCDVSIVNVLDGTSAVRSSFVDKGEDDSQIFTAVAPTGLKNITAYVYAIMEASAEVDPSTLQLVTDKRYIGNNESSIAQAAKASLKAGKTTVVTKYVGGATSDGFKNPKAVAKTASLRAMRTGFDPSLVCHKAEWASVLPSDSVDTYTFPENGTLPDDAFVIESAITAVLNEYYLLQNTISQNALDNLNNAPIDTNSISVGGLTSDAYGGLVFWDSEIW